MKSPELLDRVVLPQGVKDWELSIIFFPIVVLVSFDKINFINLEQTILSLPWSENKKIKQKKKFWNVFICLIISGMINISAENSSNSDKLLIFF